MAIFILFILAKGRCIWLGEEAQCRQLALRRNFVKLLVWLNLQDFSSWKSIIWSLFCMIGSHILKACILIEVMYWYCQEFSFSVIWHLHKGDCLIYAGIKDLHVHIQKADLETSPADEVCLCYTMTMKQMLYLCDIFSWVFHFTTYVVMLYCSITYDCLSTSTFVCICWYCSCTAKWLYLSDLIAIFLFYPLCTCPAYHMVNLEHYLLLPSKPEYRDKEFLSLIAKSFSLLHSSIFLQYLLSTLPICHLIHNIYSLRSSSFLLKL